MSEQKMREALEAAYEAHKDDFEQPWLSLAAEALATPASEQVGLTDAIDALKAMAIKYAPPESEIEGSDDDYMMMYWPTWTKAMRVIAAHKAKRGSLG